MPPKLIHPFIAASLLAFVPCSFATALLSDGFETSTHAAGNRTIATAPGAAFYTRYNINGSASIVSDATLGSRALSVADTADGAFSFPVIGKLPSAVDLQVNETISLSFRFRYVNNGTSNTATFNGFRFGLEDSATTAISGDNDTNSDNDRGYYAGLGFSGSTPTTSQIFYNEAGGLSQILSGNDRASITASANTGTGPNDNNVHTASLSVKRTATAIQLSLVVDGGTPITGSSSTNMRTRFDELAFGGGFTTTGQAYMVDDVVVSYVPEPALIGLVTLAFPLMARRRR